MQGLLGALRDAAARRAAIGHFNVSDLVGFEAVIRAARQLKLPVLIGVSEGERAFLGVRRFAALVESARQEFALPVFLNADHTKSLENARAAAEAGFDEIIFDASAEPFEKNAKLTRQAVEVLKSIRPEVVVEGEVGYIGASSEIVESVPPESLTLTTPAEAAQFVAETKVDVLAPAVGNMHGLLPAMARGEAHKRLDIERIREIKQSTPAFLTLHGGSGTADSDFAEGIQAGLSIIHVNTELRVAWRRGLENGLKAHPRELAPYKILPDAVAAVEEVVLARLRLFNGAAARSPQFA